MVSSYFKNQKPLWSYLWTQDVYLCRVALHFLGHVHWGWIMSWKSICGPFLYISGGLCMYSREKYSSQISYERERVRKGRLNNSRLSNYLRTFSNAMFLYNNANQERVSLGCSSIHGSRRKWNVHSALTQCSCGHGCIPPCIVIYSLIKQFIEHLLHICQPMDQAWRRRMKWICLKEIRIREEWIDVGIIHYEVW